MESFHHDGYASIFNILQKDKGRCNIIIVSSTLFAFALFFTMLYVLNVIEAPALVYTLTSINFAMPSLVLFQVLYLKCKFSGVPTKDEFKHRLKKLQTAVFIWTISRFIRAVWGLWDADLFFDMMVELGLVSPAQKHEDVVSLKEIDYSEANLYIPMSLIVGYLTVELFPLFYVLDGSFSDIFLRQSVLIEKNDLSAPFLMQDSHNQLSSNQQNQVPVYSAVHSISNISSMRQSDFQEFAGSSI